MKGSGDPDEWTEIDRFDEGVGWIAYPDETMLRASHALAVDGDVWVIDPVDVPGLDDLLTEYGEVAGVVLLLDRHKRDCAAVANRHDVSVWVPAFMDGVVDELDAPTERFRYDLADTGITAHTVIDNRVWQEAMLYREDTGTIVVPEAVGTPEYFRTKTERLGVHPMLRITPPKNLSRLEPDRIRVGHGEGIHEDAAAALDDALQGSRRRSPWLYLGTAKDALFG
jgi:hypothetical protein